MALIKAPRWSVSLANDSESASTFAFTTCLGARLAVE